MSITFEPDKFELPWAVWGIDGILVQVFERKEDALNFISNIEWRY